jgi:hypothetical protein
MKKNEKPKTGRTLKEKLESFDEKLKTLEWREKGVAEADARHRIRVQQQYDEHEKKCAALVAKEKALGEREGKIKLDEMATRLGRAKLELLRAEAEAEITVMKEARKGFFW